MIKKRRILLVDGYNLMGANHSINQLSKDSLESARKVLLQHLGEYQAVTKEEMICVFDAYEVKSVESIEDFHGITVVFTKEKETADEYIERFVHQNLHPHLVDITVVTSDLTEQNSIFAQGAYRIPSREMWNHIENAEKKISKSIDAINEKLPRQKMHFSDDVKAKLEKLRRGKN